MVKKVLTFVILAGLFALPDVLMAQYRYRKPVCYRPARYPVYPVCQPGMNFHPFPPPPQVVVVIFNQYPEYTYSRPVLRSTSYMESRRERIYRPQREFRRYRSRSERSGESPRIDRIEREITEIKLELKELCRKVGELVSARTEHREPENGEKAYAEDIQKMRTLKKELLELKELLKELKNSG